jgi:hypothetical protein
MPTDRKRQVLNEKEISGIEARWLHTLVAKHTLTSNQAAQDVSALIEVVRASWKERDEATAKLAVAIQLVDDLRNCLPVERPEWYNPALGQHGRETRQRAREFLKDVSPRAEAMLAVVKAVRELREYAWYLMRLDHDEIKKLEEALARLGGKEIEGGGEE